MSTHINAVIDTQMSVEVFKYLSGNDLLNASKVSKLWNKKAGDEWVWYNLCKGESNSFFGSRKKEVLYKDLYTGLGCKSRKNYYRWEQIHIKHGSGKYHVILGSTLDLVIHCESENNNSSESWVYFYKDNEKIAKLKGLSSQYVSGATLNDRYAALGFNDGIQIIDFSTSKLFCSYNFPAAEIKAQNGSERSYQFTSQYVYFESFVRKKGVCKFDRFDPQTQEVTNLFSFSYPQESPSFFSFFSSDKSVYLDHCAFVNSGEVTFFANVSESLRNKLIFCVYNHKKKKVVLQKALDSVGSLIPRWGAAKPVFQSEYLFWRSGSVVHKYSFSEKKITLLEKIQVNEEYLKSEGTLAIEGYDIQFNLLAECTVRVFKKSFVTELAGRTVVEHEKKKNYQINLYNLKSKHTVNVPEPYYTLDILDELSMNVCYTDLSFFHNKIALSGSVSLYSESGVRIYKLSNGLIDRRLRFV